MNMTTPPAFSTILRRCNQRFYAIKSSREKEFHQDVVRIDWVRIFGDALGVEEQDRDAANEILTRTALNFNSDFQANVLNLVVRAITTRGHHMGYRLDHGLIRFMVERSMWSWKDPQNFGVFFMTMGETARRYGCSRSKIREHYRRLEFLGVLSHEFEATPTEMSERYKHFMNELNLATIAGELPAEWDVSDMGAVKNIDPQEGLRFKVFNFVRILEDFAPTASQSGDSLCEHFIRVLRSRMPEVLKTEEQIIAKKEELRKTNRGKLQKGVTAELVMSDAARLAGSQDIAVPIDKENINPEIAKRWMKKRTAVAKKRNPEVVELTAPELMQDLYFVSAWIKDIELGFDQQLDADSDTPKVARNSVDLRKFANLVGYDVREEDYRIAANPGEAPAERGEYLDYLRESLEKSLPEAAYRVGQDNAELVRQMLEQQRQGVVEHLVWQNTGETVIADYAFIKDHYDEIIRWMQIGEKKKTAGAWINLNKLPEINTKLTKIFGAEIRKVISEDYMNLYQVAKHLILTAGDHVLEALHIHKVFVNRVKSPVLVLNDFSAYLDEWIQRNA